MIKYKEGQVTREDYVYTREYSIRYRQIDDLYYYNKDKEAKKIYDDCVNIKREYTSKIKWWNIFKRFDINYIPRFSSGEICYKSQKYGQIFNLFAIVFYLSSLFIFHFPVSIVLPISLIQITFLIVSSIYNKKYYKELKHYIKVSSNDKTFKNYIREQKLKKILR